MNILRTLTILTTNYNSYSDKPERVIAFSQYAQYCCNTTGSSINQIAKYFQQQRQQQPSFHLSFIDRWPTQPGLIQTFTELIRNEIKQFPVNSGSATADAADAASDEIILLFTAHSLPLNVSSFLGNFFSFHFQNVSFPSLTNHNSYRKCVHSFSLYFSVETFFFYHCFHSRSLFLVSIGKPYSIYRVREKALVFHHHQNIFH